MNCPYCQKDIPAENSGGPCPFCGKELSPRNKRWCPFFAVLFTPAIGTFVSESLKAESVAVGIAIFGSLIGGLICAGIMTYNLRRGVLSFLLNGFLMFCLSFIISCIGCTASSGFNGF
jgi:hypothetical protein